MKLSLRVKLAAGLAAVLALVVAVGVVALHEVRVQARHTDRLTDASLPEADLLGTMATRLYALRSVQADMVVDGARQVPRLRTVIGDDRQTMDDALTAYGRLAAGRDPRVAAFARRWRAYVARTRTLPDLVDAGERDAAKQLLRESIRDFLAARKIVVGLADARGERLAATADGTQRAAHDAAGIVRDLTIAGVLLCALVAALVLSSSDRDIRWLSGFRSAFDASGDGAALLDAHGRTLRVNRRLGELLGREPDTLAGLLWDEIVEPAGDGASPERPYTLPDGRQVWLNVHVMAVTGTGGRETDAHSAVKVRDVTDRHVAERALGDSEERFRTAFEETNIGMAIVSGTGTVLRVNQALEQTILGYEREELLGRHILDLTHPDDFENDVAIGALLASGAQTSVEHERRYRHRNGYWVWCTLNLSAIYDDDGGIGQFVVQVQDATQRRAIEQFLRETESRYRSLVEHLPLITYRDRLDEHSSNLFISPQAEALLGHPLQDWVDDPHTFARSVHPEDREHVMAAIRAANDERRDLTVEFRVLTADGRVATFLKEGAIVYGADGEPLYRQGYLMDVTERRALEDQLRLAQKLESVGSMAAGIAHEINTPVQFIGDSMAFVREAVDDLMRLGDEAGAAVAAIPGPEGDAARARLAAAEEDADLEYLRERLPKAFDRTVDGVERVAAIVRAMKAFSHPSNGVHAPVDLNEAVRTTLMVAKAEYKYVADVALDLDDALPLVSGEAGELNQVLLNLIVNAAHAIGDAQADGERGRIAISTARDGDAVRLAVSDTGPGIPEDVRTRIFDPFFTTKEVGRGTGQGLAITRSIVVDHHGGRIDVDTAEGRGTTMTITLPTGAAAALDDLELAA
jgi:PAS domain S-box-containing protein